MEKIKRLVEPIQNNNILIFMLECLYLKRYLGDVSNSKWLNLVNIHYSIRLGEWIYSNTELYPFIIFTFINIIKNWFIMFSPYFCYGNLTWNMTNWINYCKSILVQLLNWFPPFHIILLTELIRKFISFKFFFGLLRQMRDYLKRDRLKCIRL